MHVPQLILHALHLVLHFDLPLFDVLHIALNIGDPVVDAVDPVFEAFLSRFDTSNVLLDLILPLFQFNQLSISSMSWVDA